MTSRLRSSRGRRSRAVAALALIAGALTSFHAVAQPDCVAAPGLGPGLKKMVEAFSRADRTGHVTLSTNDFLTGVTNIQPPDQAALNRRGPVAVASTGRGTGSIDNSGDAALQFEGIFANERTFFRVPQRIKARYVNGPGGVTLYYAAPSAIQVGQAIPLTDFPVFRTINHVVFTSGQLLFFWSDGTDADRCYVPA